MALWKLKLPSSYYAFKKKAKKAAKRKSSRHPHKGHPISASTRRKISAALKGKKHKGHPVSAATRAKISAALKGKSHPGHSPSAATRAKISAALKRATHKAHAMSAATRAKLSAAASARDRALAKQHLSAGTAIVRKPAKPVLPWRNPIRRARYRLITANARHHPLPALLRRKRKRRRNLSLHLRVRYHRVWQPKGRRRRR
jgi:hypothetical protein